MESKSSYNYDFLNSYFSTKEFNFINNANLEYQNLDAVITKESNSRDIVIDFISHLNDFISNSTDNKNEFLQLLTEIQNIFEQINDSIKMLHNLKIIYSEISDKIVRLLIKIESSNYDSNHFENQIQEIKDLINKFEIENEDVKAKVLLNDIKVDTFFQKSIVKKCLSSLDITYNDSIYNNDNIYTKDTVEDNNSLLVSEKSGKVFLPYTKSEVALYLEQYPNEYTSLNDVIKKEFVLSLDYYMKHPVIARFREAYSLIRDRESKSIIDAFKYALEFMFRYELNPVIIAACKTQEQLENYMSCLEKNKLYEFNDFEIKFEINPF